jgi:hypothetical protein
MFEFDEEVFYHLNAEADRLDADERRRKYKEYLASDIWKAQTDLIRAFYGYVCARCGISEEEVGHKHDCHHRSYDYFGTGGPMERFCCVLLCRECHEEWHKLDRAMKARWTARSKRKGR